MKINWRQKLSSRKFWAAAAAYLTSVLGAFNVSGNAAAQAVLLVSGMGALAVYMLAESNADAGNKQ